MLLRMICVDVEPEVEDSFNAWYSSVHIPKVLACPGFVSGRRYVSIGGVPAGSPKYMALYEVENPETLESEALRQIAGWHEFQNDIRQDTRNTYQPYFPEEHLPLRGGLFLRVVRTDIAPEHEDDFNRWYNEVHIPEIVACPGIVSGRRYLSIEGVPKYMALYEFESMAARRTEQFRQAAGWKDFEPFVHSVTYTTYHQIYPREVAADA